MIEQASHPDQFAAHRAHLHAVAYRMLGSLAEADDAVQETWLRLAAVDTSAIDNLGGWLTTVVSRICLDLLRARTARREQPIEVVRLPDPLVTRDPGPGPEEQAVLADAVGLAMLVVLDSLRPAERLAFVLHDVFGMPYEQIAPIVDRTPQTTKKLASQARRRVQGEAPVADPDPLRRRRAVDAFLAAARDGDFDGLLRILDPDVVVRTDAGPGQPGTQVLCGADEVVGRAAVFQRMAVLARSRHVLVNGGPGLVNTVDGELVSVMGFAVVDGRIAEMDILSDPARLAALGLTAVVGLPAAPDSG